MSKKISINVDRVIFLPLESLNFFQGELKELSEIAFYQLRKEILETGFNFVYHVWKNLKDERWYILDGHQRTRVLTKMKNDEFFDVPDLPAVPVNGKTYKEAKRVILQGISQYGKVTDQGLYQFMHEAEIIPQDLVDSFDIPGINGEKFARGHFDSYEGKEVDVVAHKRNIEARLKDTLEEKNERKEVIECPDCGHLFDYVPK